RCEPEQPWYNSPMRGRGGIPPPPRVGCPRRAAIPWPQDAVMTPDEIAELRRQRYNATVALLRRTHSDLMIIRVRPDFPVPYHNPAQYTTVGMGCWAPPSPGCQEEILKPGEEVKLARRSYSISCSVLDEGGNLLDCEHNDWIEFYVVL